MDHGAHFYRCDFQVHTPRDQNWKGADATTPEERQAYAARLIAACRAKGLDAIAITDHHDMAFVPYIRQAAADEVDEAGKPLALERRVVVFPGMELTLGVPCQAILILDADFPDSMFVPVLTALKINQVPDDASRNGNVTRLDGIHSFKDLQEDLDKHSWLKGRYIIFPNVTGEGKFSLLRDGQYGKYIEMPCVGGYVDGPLGKLKPSIQQRLDGKIKEWGFKRIACFQTSDNRREDHAVLGDPSTWVKWAKPTAEALRQACLAQESRISQAAPLLPTTAITRIEISNSSFLGPISLELNTQYTALIGGRGTGKSTLLEYLRWALCDQPPSTPDAETPNYQARRARLIDQTLGALGAVVDITFSVNGVPHIVRRQSKDGTLEIKIGDEDMRGCTESEVRSLLPIQAYSQKQLSDVSVRLEELTRFMTGPIAPELAVIDRRVEECANRVRETYSSRQRRQRLEADLENRRLATTSLEGQALNIRSSLTGLSEIDRQLLDQGGLFEARARTVERWRADLAAIGKATSELIQLIELSRLAPAIPGVLPDDSVLAPIEAEYRRLVEHAQMALQSVSTDVTAALGARDDPATAWAGWYRDFAAYREAYAEAVSRSSSHQELMTSLEAIETRLSEHHGETVRLGDQIKSLHAAEDAYERARREWAEFRVKRDGLLEQQSGRLTANSLGAIRATIKPFADLTAFIDRLRESLSGSGLRREKIEGLAAVVTGAANPETAFGSLLANLEALATFQPSEAGSGKRPDAPALSAAGFTSGDLDRVASRLSPSEWLELSLVQIKNEPIFEYRSKENQYIPFRNASAGQQATALLKTLLNEQGPPLIVDQPEEDLDNPVITEIVEQIWEAKKKRQIIFASHNANLVVNGDAELVVWCDYRKAGDQSGGKIAGEGAIDVHDVREAIKRIMEGGEHAFRARREKYGF